MSPRTRPCSHPRGPLSRDRWKDALCVLSISLTILSLLVPPQEMPQGGAELASAFPQLGVPGAGTAPLGLDASPGITACEDDDVCEGDPEEDLSPGPEPAYAPVLRHALDSPLAVRCLATPATLHRHGRSGWPGWDAVGATIQPTCPALDSSVQILC